jgi:zinc/manganese transport system permease protein
MLDYDFMRSAFLASGLAGVLAGFVGFFLVLRAQTFAGHALSHVGFAGATGAALIGLSPFAGLLALTLAAPMAMGALGERLAERDVAVGMVLSLALGFGALFLNFTTTAANSATALLFGDVLGVDDAALIALGVLAPLGVIALAFIFRPLAFASLQPELAEARGVPVKALSMAFLALVALATAASAQVVGVLLVFTLMVGPGAAAMNFSRRVAPAAVLAAVLAVGEAWAGLALAYATDWPPSFWIVVMSALVYALSLVRR